MTKFTEIEAAEDSRDRVVILTGPEMVPATDIYALVNSRAVREVILTHEESDSMIREYEDLCQLMPPLAKCVVRRGVHMDAASAAIAIISGPAKKRDGAEGLVATEAAQIEAAGFTGVIIVTGFPPDILATAVMNVVNLDASRIIAIGPQSHGSEPINDGWEATNVWCTASSAPVNAIDTCTPDCPYFEKMLDRSYRVFEKSDTDDSIRGQRLAVCVTQLCNAILNNSHAIVPVYAAVSTNGGMSFKFSPREIGQDGVVSSSARDRGFSPMEEMTRTSFHSATRSRDRNTPA